MANEKVTIYISQREYLSLKDMADQRNSSLNYIIRTILREFLANRHSTVPQSTVLRRVDTDGAL